MKEFTVGGSRPKPETLTTEVIMLSLRKILVPVDFSEFSEKAVEYGSEFAKAFGAELVLCHVLELPVYPVAIGLGSVPPIMTDDLMPDIEKRLEADAAQWVDPEVKVQRIVREGAPFVEIVQMARDEDVDLIIMPTHGRTGLSHVFMGSTAERVVRKAPCPVLVVRDGEREFIHP